jgi:cyclic pyranopterin phosphate synthase
MRGVNDDEVPQFVEMTRDKPLDIRFIEYMPFGGNKWKHNKLVPYTELLERIAQHYKIDQLERCTDAPNDTSKAYRVPGHVGKIGFISSMTDHFCSTCNRLRLTADGNLKVCLFGNTEVNLRDMLRSNATKEEVVKVISTAVKRKKKQHAGMFELANSTNRPMILIGG